jgi:ribonuclease HI
LYPFPDKIVIQDRKSAIQTSCDIFQQGFVERQLTIWVDGSVEQVSKEKRTKRLAASAIRYLDPSSKDWAEFVTLNTLPPRSISALEAEMIAVHEAFRKACDLNNDFDHILILTDCQSLLYGLRKNSRFGALSTTKWITNLLRYANMLYDFGITVELRWVPGYAGIEGNERVDKLAKRFRKSAQSILSGLQQNISLHYVTAASDVEELINRILSYETQSESSRQFTTINRRIEQ